MSAAVLIGLLGCGRAAERLHVPAILETRGARLVAASDPVAERRQLIARAAPGCRAFATPEELFAARGVDAVIVASPPDTHATLAGLALRAGLPALVETPLATSLEDALWLTELERKIRQPLMVGFNRRWWEPAQAARGALARAGDTPTTVETLIVEAPDAGPAPTGTADPLEDLAVHHLYLLPYLLDHVIATVRAHRFGTQEVELLLRFGGGGAARCVAGFGPRRQERVAIATGSRRVTLERSSSRIRPASGPVRGALDLAGAVRRRVFGGSGSLARSYQRQLRAFLECVRTGRGGLVVSPGTVDGIAAMLAVQAARESLERHGAEIPVLPLPAT